MSIERLKELIDPPQDPINPMGDWESVERELCSPLPRDYKRYVNSYGDGGISDFIWVFNPFSKNQYLNLLTQVPIVLKAFQQIREIEGEEFLYELFPKAGGLLPCGATGNGDIIFWETRGDPDGWSTAVLASRENDAQTFKLTLTELLSSLLSGETTCSVFPNDWLDPAPSFKPR
jgi:hypothetical protein